MISLTRISGSPLVLNCDLIERVDQTPDTVVTLMDGKKYVVLESPRDITSLAIHFRSQVLALSQRLTPAELPELPVQPERSHLSSVTPISQEH